MKSEYSSFKRADFVYCVLIVCAGLVHLWLAWISRESLVPAIVYVSLAVAFFLAAGYYNWSRKHPR